MCYIEEYGKLNPTCSYYLIVGCEIPLPGGSTTDALVSLSFTMNFIGNFLQSF